MKIAELGDVRLHYRVDGPDDGPPVVFANSLGTDLRLWDKVLPLLPPGLRLVRYDKRGHGLSSCPPAPYCPKGCGSSVSTNAGTGCLPARPAPIRWARWSPIPKRCWTCWA